MIFQGNTIESEHLSELTEEEYEAQYIKRQNLKGFMRLDVEYLNPFFTRRLTQEVSLSYFLEEGKLVGLVVVLSTTQGSWCSHL